MARQLGDNLSVQNGLPPPRNPNAPRPAMLKGFKRTRIILEENDNIPPTGLFVGFNGNTYMIMAGIEVDVPDPLIEILDNAVQMIAIVNPQTKQVIGHRQRMRFPYRLVQDKVDRHPAAA